MQVFASDKQGDNRETGTVSMKWKQTFMAVILIWQLIRRYFLENISSLFDVLCASQS